MLATPTGESTVPVITGVFPPEPAVRAGKAPLPGPRGLISTGSWHPGEMRAFTHRGVGLLLLGRCLATDAQIAVGLREAAETGDDRLLASWPGGFTSIVVREDRLRVTVDLAGQYPVYFRTRGGSLFYGTHAAATSAAAGFAPQPDLVALAAGVFCPDLPLLEGQSPVAGVRCLAGGEVLTADLSWRAPVITGDLPRPEDRVSAAEAAVTLRSALRSAVEARTGDGVGITADFSGGQDSTSVAFLAARRSTLPLGVYTYRSAVAPADDARHARGFAQAQLMLSHREIVGDATTLPYATPPLDPSDLPDPAAPAWARTRLRLSAIAESGSRVHLGGEGADALLAPGPGYLVDLVSRGMGAEAFRHAAHHARARQVSPADVLAKAVRAARTPHRRAMLEAAARIGAPAPNPVRWLDAIGRWTGPGVEARWLTAETRRALVDLALAAASTPPHDDLGVADRAAVREIRAAGRVQRRLVDAARAYGVWPQAPFLDDGVVRACARVPGYRKAGRGERKPLLAAALSGLVPDGVFARRSKGDYSGEDYAGLRANHTALVELLNRSRLGAAGVVDPGAVVESVRSGRDGLPVPMAAINRVVAAELWLRGLEVGL